MTSVKIQIETWLVGRVFENSKEALNKFEKETGTKVSVVYFSRVFSEHVEASRKTKKEKVAAFIRGGEFKTCDLAHKAYVATGDEVSPIYFSRVYTEVRKVNKPAAKVKIAKPTVDKTEVVKAEVKAPVAEEAPAKQKEFHFKGMTGKEILEKAESVLAIKIEMSPNNRSRVCKRVATLLTDEGFKIIE